jgi:hypothetical protein
VLLLPEESQMMNSLMLIGAIFASLALGVLGAYGICQLIFRIFLIHAKSTARRVQASNVRINAES